MTFGFLARVLGLGWDCDCLHVLTNQAKWWSNDWKGHHNILVSYVIWNQNGNSLQNYLNIPSIPFWLCHKPVIFALPAKISSLPPIFYCCCCLVVYQKTCVCYDVSNLYKFFVGAFRRTLLSFTIVRNVFLCDEHVCICVYVCVCACVFVPSISQYLILEPF